MSKILSKLFGSSDRVKIIRLFLWNPEEIFSPKDIAEKAKVSSPSLRRELNLLSSIGFIKKKKRKNINGWIVDSSFPLLLSLKALALDTTVISRKELIKKISSVGIIKLIVLAGVFIQTNNNESRADILIVGDKINKKRLEKVLKEIEAEIGKELTYALFSKEDFIYRLGIYDKFVRDILDYPHEIILDKIGLSDIL